MTHFAQLAKEIVKSSQKYAEYINRYFNQIISIIIPNARKNAVSIKMFHKNDAVAEEFQMKLIDVQNNTDLRNDYCFIKYGRFL